ncbi:uncharacterized protein [Clytia hemisphaerica]|uniref:tRNA (guanine(37)-N1)-methyltransferase n=1 Tax=Clytia hemisphaerica TaxID=252671 RepID=A0A7M5V4I7_9CNID
MTAGEGCLKLPFVDLVSLIPDTVKKMNALDKSLFDSSIDVPAIKCLPALCGMVQKEFKYILFNRPHFRKIIPCEEKNSKDRLILLHTHIKTKDDLSKKQLDFMEKNRCTFLIHHMTISYNDFTFDEIVKKIFPENTKDIVTSFETVGHIAHLNLKPTMFDHKKLIGELLLDKNKNIKTVVNKTNSIEETFRFFKMELLAGEDKMNATVHEHGCVFEFDYSKVYWNSRLQTEHQRIVKEISPEDVVYDVFAGVGPFSIPVAKKAKEVYANDLNVESYKALKHNAELNKVQVKAYNLEGREFLDQIVIEEGICKTETCESLSNRKKHIIMNLPAIAPEFLDVFADKYATFNLPLKIHPNILIHCYCFCKTKTPEEEAILRVSEILQVDISPTSKVHFVRRVAPNKVMMCVTFNLIWFEHKVEKCSCTNLTSEFSRKRPAEGGDIPMEGKKTRL